jgi:hypothetical protein
MLQPDNKNRVEVQTQNYWIGSSLWNGRLPWVTPPTVSDFINALKQATECAPTWRLAGCFAFLLGEVIRLGNKKTARKGKKATLYLFEPKLGNHIPEGIATQQMAVYEAAVAQQ